MRTDDRAQVRTQRERPILFRPEMVRAILDGRKTQTRRIVKFPATTTLGTIDPGGTIFGPGPYIKPKQAGHSRIYCPYGYPGDRLWVKERWRPVATNHKQWTSVLYFADGEQRDCPYFKVNFSKAGARPSIHMPRVASRLTLDITEIRVERVQDISEADAVSEGLSVSVVDPYPRGEFLGPGNFVKNYATARDAFRDLWDHIRFEGLFRWTRNPWVWVVSFRRVA